MREMKDSGIKWIGVIPSAWRRDELNDPRLKARGSLKRLKVAHQLKQVYSGYSSSIVKLSTGCSSL